MLVSNRLRTTIISIALLCALVAGVAFSPLGTVLYDKYDPRLYPGAWLNHPFKTVDPNDPNFDPLRFRYMDYRTEELAAVFGRMFKPGDSRSYVEAVLVQSAGSRLDRAVPEFAIYTWNYPERFTAHWKNPDMLRIAVYAVYDNNGRLFGIKGLWAPFVKWPGFQFNAEPVQRMLHEYNKETDRKRVQDSNRGRK